MAFGLTREDIMKYYKQSVPEQQNANVPNTMQNENTNINQAARDYITAIYNNDSGNEAKSVSTPKNTEVDKIPTLEELNNPNIQNEDIRNQARNYIKAVFDGKIDENGALVENHNKKSASNSNDRQTSNDKNTLPINKTTDAPINKEDADKEKEEAKLNPTGNYYQQKALYEKKKAEENTKKGNYYSQKAIYEEKQGKKGSVEAEKTLDEAENIGLRLGTLNKTPAINKVSSEEINQIKEVVNSKGGNARAKQKAYNDLAKNIQTKYGFSDKEMKTFEKDVKSDGNYSAKKEAKQFVKDNKLHINADTYSEREKENALVQSGKVTQEQLDNYKNILNKGSMEENTTSAIAGFGSALAKPVTSWGSVVSKDMSDANQYAQESLEEIRQNNPIATSLGEVGGNMFNYALTGNVLGEGASLLGNFARQQGADVLLTEVPQLINNIQRGTYQNEDGSFNYKQLGLDATDMAVQDAALNLIPEVGKLGKDVAFNQFIKPILENTEMASSVAKNIPTDGVVDAVRNGIKSANNVEPLAVGKATTIKNPYMGEVPTQQIESRNRISIPEKDYNNAITNLNNAEIDSQLEGANKKTILTKVYETLFGKEDTSFDIGVNGTQFDGQNYNVTVNKNAIGKIVSDPNMSPEKLAVIDNLEEVIANSEFVGSGNFVKEGSNKNVIRYDYFETDANINGTDYVVTFDVEVVPGRNNYRTHKVINEINLTQASDNAHLGRASSEVLAPSGETGPLPDAQGGVLGSSTSNIAEELTKVNENAQANVPKTDLDFITETNEQFPVTNSTGAFKQTKVEGFNQLDSNINSLQQMFGNGETENSVVELKKLLNDYANTGNEESLNQARQIASDLDNALNGNKYTTKSGRDIVFGSADTFGYEVENIANSMKNVANSKAYAMPGLENISTKLDNMLAEYGATDEMAKAVNDYKNAINNLLANPSKENFDSTVDKGIALTKQFENSEKVTNTFKNTKQKFDASELDEIANEVENIYKNNADYPRTVVNNSTTNELPTINEPVNQPNIPSDIPTVEPQNPDIAKSRLGTNTMTKIDAEETAKDLSNGVYDHVVKHEQDTMKTAGERITNDKEGWFNKLVNQDSSSFTAEDVDTSMMLLNDLKKQRAIAIESGDNVTAESLNAQITSLKKRMSQAATNSGQVSQAWAKWSRDADGSIFAAEGLVAKNYDKLTKENPRLVNDAKNVANSIEERIKDKSVDDLWNELVNGGETTYDELTDRVNTIIDEAIDHSKNNTVKKNFSVDARKNMSRQIAAELQQGADFSDVVDEIGRIGTTGFGGINDEVEQQVRAIFDEAEKYGYNSKQRVKLENQAYSILANATNLNGSFGDKLNAWRYFAMLSNPKTHLRNIIGNISFGAITDIKDNVGAIIEGAVDKATGGTMERSKTLLGYTGADGQLRKAARENADEIYRELVDGNKYYNTGASIEANKDIFRNKVLNKITGLNGDLLNAEDEFALYNKYSSSLARYLKANGLDTKVFDNAKRYEEVYKQLSDAKLSQIPDNDLISSLTRELDDLKSSKEALITAQEYAIGEAKKATFHQQSLFADKLSEFSRQMAQGNVAEKIVHIALEGTLPFKKTPVNILKSAAAYSPLEVGKIIADIPKVHKGSMKASEFIDDIAKGLTGTALMVGGYQLAKAGIVNGSDDSEGNQKFSINIGDGSYTIDGFAPASLPLLVGANFYESMEGATPDEKFENFMNAITSVSEPLVETTMLQGISDLFESVSYAAKEKEQIIPAIGATMGSNYATQFVPTELGNIARSVDDTRRTTYTGKSGIPNLVQKSINSTRNKIPGLSQNSQPYLNEWGEEQKNVGGSLGGRLAYQHLSPGYYQETDNSERTQELRRLRDVTGDEKVINNGVSTSVTVNGAKVKLSPEELTQYSSSAGQTKAQLVEALMSRPEYQEMSDEGKVEAINKLYDLGNKVGLQNTFEEYQNKDSLLKVFNSERGIEGVIDSVISSYDKSKNDAELEAIGVPANATTKKLYEEDDTKALEEWKNVQAKADSYGVEFNSTEKKAYDKLESDSEKEQYLQYMAEVDKRDESVSARGFQAYKDGKYDKFGEYKDLLDKYNISDSDELYNTWKNTGTSTLESKLKTKAAEKEEKAKETSRLESYSLSDYGLNKISSAKTYEKAIKEIPTLSVQDFATTYKKIDKDGSEGIQQQEIIDYLNSGSISESQAKKIWSAYGNSEWKKIPVLVNGTWKLKKK